MKRLFSFLFLTALSVSQALAACDPNAVLVLHCEGADASTTFTDSSNSAHAMTANGNAQIDTAQFKFGSASGLFDGTGDYVSGTTSSDYAFGTGNFTLECWVRFNSVASFNQGLMNVEDSTNGIDTLFTSTTNFRAFIAGTQHNWVISAITTGIWYHIALVRSGSTVTFYLDGSSQGNVTNSGSISNTLGTKIGSRFDGLEGFNGWIDEVRFSNVARYTGNFTPSGPFCGGSKELALLGCG